jgi:photosystem II stability/assembly factor-like uncharacterized protein
MYLRLTGEPASLITFGRLFCLFWICMGEFTAGMSGLRIFSDFLRRRGLPASVCIIFLYALCALRLSAQAAWSPVGPEGGDARAFAAVPGHPDRLYLGTTDSWIYESFDGGASWRRLAKLDHSDGLILDHIVVDSADPSTIFVAAWNADRPDGGLWISHDAGRTWSEPAGMRGRSIRAFVQAPSDPRVLFAGTLEGVFRSVDAGATWTQISPLGSREIHEVESLAVDPVNPDILYAGTWHLPWKTDDGGKTWHSIKRGLIVDSDIFSIIVDPDRPHIVYLSACSGIYKSEDAGAWFRKIQGIPSAARRTRAIAQDPENREIVYAGTTEGLYKTVNGGRTFQRMTGSDVIVNDVYVDPGDPNHVLLATDRGGVLASDNGGFSFVESNRGISERKVEALLVDPRNPRRLYAGVVNDKTYGGVFVSSDGGATWNQIAAGLDGRDIYALAETKDGTVVAGTNRGIFVLDPPVLAPPGLNPSGSARPLAGALSSALTWEPRNTIANTIVKTATRTYFGTRVNVEKQMPAPVIELESRVNALDVSGDVWLAATSYGLLTSRDQGASWQGGPVMGQGEYLSVAVHGKTMAAARADGVVLSRDGGGTWLPMDLPRMLTRIHCVAFSPDGTLWLGAREGVYFTRDLGKTWLWFGRLPFRDVDDLSFDPALGRMLASSWSSDQIFAIDLKTMTWKWWQTGYRVSLIRAAGDRLVAASLADGVLVDPLPVGVDAGRK